MLNPDIFSAPVVAFRHIVNWDDLGETIRSAVRIKQENGIGDITVARTDGKFSYISKTASGQFRIALDSASLSACARFDTT